MIVSIDYLKTVSYSSYSLKHYYLLVDDKYTKNFEIIIQTNDSYINQQTIIANEILYFIYKEYKNTKYCPFLAIKKMYENNSLFSSNNICQTLFYKTYYKVMEKFIPTAYSNSIIYNFAYSTATAASNSYIYYPNPQI